MQKEFKKKHDVIQTSEDGNYSWCCLWYVCKSNKKCGKESTFDISLYPKYFNNIVKKPDCFDVIEQLKQKLEEQRQEIEIQMQEYTEKRAKEIAKKHGI